ncbi:phosphate regulon transcriptional regulatory protein PhoB [Desulfocucumis palustris]|uniref:Heme response regulator HssR n=1 Tax=Desulfocucumis palustris TaxID=1898651 RepID=A0A2L2XFF8_9FIRM|nr:response regulator transcription factor [Desulfocucumis palustris]GBF34978.1 phosphate regulon transcriptional regulatory protein PhoB [Desulfocucumis palustris]
MPGNKVMVVEDELEIRNLLKLYLNKKGYHVVLAEDGNEALRLFEYEQPDLIILDILLPQLNGYQVCQELRKYSNVPILFISCKKDSEDIIQGLHLGGDDYITKPFDPNVLVARVEAKLRRAPIFRRTSTFQETPKKDVLTCGNLEINLSNYQVLVDGNPIPLSAKEFQLLFFLAQHPDQVFTSEDLYKKIWGYDCAGDVRTVMTHVSNIRKKIKSSHSNKEFIKNIRGIGYKFDGE